MTDPTRDPARVPAREPRRRALLDVLERARTLGFLGPGPAARQLEHALDLARAIGPVEGRVLDLGSGGGLPGLVLFERWPAASGALLDAQRRRCDFLGQALRELGLDDRIAVHCGRAEVLARDDGLRGSFDLVVARSFGPPAVTAECAVGFLRTGGELVVTEPPTSPTVRWDATGLATLGLTMAEPIRTGDTGAVRMVLRGEPGTRWPRRDGVPSKRPLW